MCQRVGTPHEEKALVDQWLEVEAHNFNDLVFKVVILPRRGPKGDSKLAETYQEEKPEKVLDVYEQRLSKEQIFSWRKLQAC
ncbi:hypothetical protein Peur_064492 [Populus x canadensis]